MALNTINLNQPRQQQHNPVSVPCFNPPPPFRGGQQPWYSSLLTILSSTILEISIRYHFLTNIGDVVVVIDTTLCDNVCPPTGRWIFPVSSTNKTDRHDITEILLKVALNTNKPIIKNIIVNKTKVILAHALVIIADFGYPV